MHKYLLFMGFAALSFTGRAANMTAITIGKTDIPVHVGVFRGLCANLELRKLRTPNDFPLLEGKSCEFVTNQTLNPTKPNETLNTWHQGSVPLILVAFQDGGSPIRCPVDDSDKLYVTQGADGLTCSTELEVGPDDMEAEETETYSAQSETNVSAEDLASDADEEPDVEPEFSDTASTNES